jgi:hypothetical protein
MSQNHEKLKTRLQRTGGSRCSPAGAPLTAGVVRLRGE